MVLVQVSVYPASITLFKETTIDETIERCVKTVTNGVVMVSLFLTLNNNSNNSSLLNNINPFVLNAPFLCPPPENMKTLRFSDVFRG